MEIVWYGLSCFRLLERGLAVVVTDPYNHEIVGLDPLKLRADIVTVSHDAPGHNYFNGIKGVSHKLTGPGEYEIGGVFITGVQTESDHKKIVEKSSNTLFLFDFDGFTIAHLGDLNQVPSQSEIEAFGNVNIALVPVGSANGLNAAKAAEVISLLDPNIVIPMHYGVKNGNLDLEPLSKFLKEMGLTSTETVPSLKITKSALPDETKIIVLDAATS